MSTTLNAPAAPPRRTRTPPRPPEHWLAGSMTEFQRDQLAFVTRMPREFGDLVRTRFLYAPCYFVSHPDLIEQVLQTKNRDFIKPISFRTPFFRRLIGTGLLTSEGDFWRRQRRLAQPAFHRDRIAAYGETMVAYADRLTGEWRDGEARDLHAEMMQLTMEIVARTLFSADVSGADAEEVKRALKEIAEPFAHQATFKWILDNRLPTPAHRRFMRTAEKLDGIIFKIIRARRESGEDAGDLLSMLLQARDEEADGAGMTDKQLRDELMTLFLAGQETTALALTWGWHLLMQHPAAETRLYEEIDAVLEGGRAPKMEDLARLRYAESVVKESMRLYPPAWGVGREAVRDVEIGGYTIPKRAQVFMMSYAVQRDPRFWREPEAFRPERWSNGETKDLPKFAYFPFGGGPRVCIGNQFAMMEAVLSLASIARRFRFTPAPNSRVEPVPGMSLRPRDGLKVIVNQR
ncbi:MAG TPA: cytochrome P450 [Pyrinomonadaceae bacterium]|jgi:cytochrome P450|nr:cytochrome P450 [Pyrinomonadaceae bacterium]